MPGELLFLRAFCRRTASQRVLCGERRRGGEAGEVHRQERAPLSPLRQREGRG